MYDAKFFATKLGKAAMASIAMMVAFIVLAPELSAIHAAPPSLVGWQQVELA
jgi:hypothetical protein